MNILYGNDLKIYKKTFDMAIITVGTIPATRFIKKAGINVDKNDFVTVDKHMKTNIDNIYAIGDIAKVESIIKGIYVTPAVVPPSKKQARVVGDNILGIDSVYSGTTNTSILSVFGYQVAKTRSFRTKINGTWY